MSPSRRSSKWPANRSQEAFFTLSTSARFGEVTVDNLLRRLVEQIRLSWNTLLPYIEKLARMTREKIQKQDTAQKKALQDSLCVAAR